MIQELIICGLVCGSITIRKALHITESFVYWFDQYQKVLHIACRSWFCNHFEPRFKISVLVSVSNDRL